MGTYVEEITLPYGPEEIKKRINYWLETDGTKYKIIQKTENHVMLERKIPISPNIIFSIHLLNYGIRAECWVASPRKSSIAPDAIWGGISRRTGWKDFQRLKEVLWQNIDEGTLQ
ncbi:MAG: hypothetical protein ACTSYL_00745 [Candidatus Thorarchaeota archaeon]